jgi:FKBP-type peptidyl-prolyl cis-trans isomerase FklB
MKNISYALGMTMAGNFLKSGIKDLDVDAFAKAMKSVYKKEATELSADEAREIIDAYFNKMQAEADSVNKQAGADYLEKNKKREGVHTTESGLQYEILQEGKGDKPKATDTVRCHYEGRLLDGRVFDSSYQRNKPADFPVNQVRYLAGWKHSNSCQ